MHAHTHDVEVKKVEKLSPTQVRLTLSFSAEVVAEHEKMTAKDYSKQASLPGFRPGKAPLKMVLDKFQDRIRRDVLSHLVEAGVSEAMHAQKLYPISRPRIELGDFTFQPGQALEFKAEFEVEPEVNVKNYKGVPIKEAPKSVDDIEVDKTIESLRERMGVLEPSDETKPTKGCFAVVEVGYALVDKPEKSEKPAPFTVELGEGKLIPEIDEAFMSMGVGEQKKVVATFPDDYNEKDLASKKAEFDCKLVELKKRTLPELNDAFAETIRPGATLLELKNDIRKNIETTRDRELKRGQRQQIIDYLVQKNQFDVPKSMVESQSRRLLESMANDLKQRGQSLPALKDEEMKTVLSSAEEIVRGGLLLKHIARQEKIELAEERYQSRIAQLAEQWEKSPEETEKFLGSQGVLDRIRDELLTDQIFDFLIENAKIEPSK